MSHPLRRSAMRQSLSYHRLRDASVARRIVAHTGLAPPALVYEFGAGDGVLTEVLAARAGRIVAVELDRSLHEQLARRFEGLQHVHAVHGDFRALRLPSRERYAVVANLPFSLTAETLRLLMATPNPPQTAFLVVQREVAATWAGLGRTTAAAVIAHVRFSFDVPLALRRRDFEPWPRVESVLLAMRRRQQPLLTAAEQRAFAGFVERGFGGGGRTLERNLRGGTGARALREALRETGVPPRAAPSGIGFEQWLELWKRLRPVATARPPRHTRASPRRNGRGPG